ncbi:tetratricopeptide repeat-containing sensor histidine kinase [Hymenobacter rigui]|uniref:histidine kinase n=1 Tax=Hymenobacter rigui TaxID=334424 RepID=A0A3R9N5L7_9BACT|nr:ATP-binding protein [Hymenobacter rigui]RSK48765.1 histidine kinase [Hymenobacter rigui]
MNCSTVPNLFPIAFLNFGRLRLLLVLLVLPMLSVAQTRKPLWHSTLDSLQALERLPQSDSSRVQLLCRISDQLWASDTEAAAAYSRKALALARRTHNHRGEGAALNRLGAALRESNLARALELFQTSLRLAEQVGDTALQSQNMRSIGIIYVYLRDRQLGLSYYFQGLRLDSLLHDERRIVVDLSNIGLAYDLYNQVDSAAYYQDRAYALAQRLHSSTNYILYGLGNVARKQARFPEALSYYRRSVAESKRRRHLRSLNFSYLGMAALYQQLQQPDSSIYYARLGVQAARANGFLRGVLNASVILTQEFEQRRQLDSAFRYQKELVAMKDTLFGQEKVMRLQNVNYLDRQQQQQAAADQQALRNRYQTYGLLAGVAGLLLLLALLVRHDRQQQRTNTALQTSLAELKEAQLMLVQREKMAFLGELTAGVAHELQNPLSFVKRFAEVSTTLVDEINGAQQLARDGRLEREILDGLKQNLQNISQHGQRATAIIKGMLEHARTGQQPRQLTNLNQLAQENLRLAYEAVQQQFPGFEAELQTKFAPALPEVAVVAQDLGRVLLNLCTNALYAVRQRQLSAGPAYVPTVEIGSRRLPDGPLQLWVRDNGAGMSAEVQQRIFEPFFTTKPVGEGTGLGLSLAHDIVVNGHQGTLQVESGPEEGTEFRLTLPG